MFFKKSRKIKQIKAQKPVDDIKRRKSKCPSEEELFTLYKEKSAKEIAELYNVKETTVRHWIADYRHPDKAYQKKTK